MDEEAMEDYRARQIAEERWQWERVHELASQMAEDCPWCWKGDYFAHEDVIRIVTQAFEGPREYRTKSAPKRPKLSTSKCLEVFARDDYRCVHCGTRENLSVDHIHPVSKGGTNNMDNLQTLCRSCNSRKGAKVSGDDQAGAGT